MDHGILNTPLKSRGDIDAQIDRYKAKMAADAKKLRKIAAEEHKALKAEAVAALNGATDDRLAQLAQKCGVTVPAMRNRLRSDCHWQPRLVIGLFPAA